MRRYATIRPGSLASQPHRLSSRHATYSLPRDGVARGEEASPSVSSHILRETKLDIRARLKSVLEGFAGSRL
jgi:hypothetical protein